MTVLPVNRFSFSYLEQFCVITQSLCGALLVAVVVRHIYSVPPRCIPSLLRRLQLSYVLYALAKAFLNTAHILSLEDCRRHSQMSSLKVAVCVERFIPFDTIIVLTISCPPDLANSRPFSSWLMIRTRGSVGSYAPLIFNAFSSRSIPSISP